MCVIRLTKEQIADVQRQLKEWEEDHPSELELLRRHVDEAKNDPDYNVIGNYADIADSNCCFSPKYPVDAIESPDEPPTK